MKIFFIAIALSLSLFGSDLLKIHKKLVPMTLLQVKSIAKKDDKTIKIIIIANKNEYLKAQELQEMFPKKIKSFSLQTEIVEELNIKKIKSMDFDAIYSFALNKASYQLIKDISVYKKCVSFANSYKGLEEGILLYIDKKKRIKIYMNAKTMKLVKVPFNNGFISIVEVVNE